MLIHQIPILQSPIKLGSILVVNLQIDGYIVCKINTHMYFINRYIYVHVSGEELGSVVEK